MAEDYKEKLKKLKESLIKKDRAAIPAAPQPALTPPTPPIGRREDKFEPNPAAAKGSLNDQKQRDLAPSRTKLDDERSPARQSALEITLGIDFGTRFTKVAAFVRQTNDYRVLAIGPTNSRFLRSWIVTDATDRVFPPDLLSSPAKGRIEYLKMHLASPNGATFGGNTRVGGIALQDAIRPLCAMYLAGVIRLAMNAARKAFASEFASHRKIEWFANVGVPVQYCDGPELTRFQEMASVAWDWKEQSPSAYDIQTLLTSYERSTARMLKPGDAPIQVVPELAAALAHFVERRTTAEGMYAFFDIGGGTLDGTAFYLKRTGQGNRLDILAAAVDDVGTMAVARRAVAEMYVKMDALVEHPIIFGSSAPSLQLPISEPGYRIQQLFNRVIRQAKMKMPKIEFDDFEKPKLKSLAGPGNYPRYPVFVAGGGARSEWYADLFRRTRADFSLHQVGIGECDVKVVPAPDGFSGDDYPRFVVAIGLTSERVLFDTYRLPSSAFPPPQLEPARPIIESPVSKDYV